MLANDLHSIHKISLFAFNEIDLAKGTYPDNPLDVEISKLLSIFARCLLYCLSFILIQLIIYISQCLVYISY